MQKRLLAGAGALALALGCAPPAPTGTPNAAATMLSPSPVRSLEEADLTLNGVASEVRYATFDVRAFPEDLDGDGAADDSRTWITLILSSTPGCSPSGQFEAHYGFEKKEIDSDGGVAAGDSIQGGGGRVITSYITEIFGDMAGVSFLVEGDSSPFSDSMVAEFKDLNETLIEITAFDGEHLSAQLSSTLLFQRNANDLDELIPIEISLLASTTEAERCTNYLNGD